MSEATESPKLNPPRWIGFKAQEQYCNNTAYWVQHLEGPFSDNSEFCQRLADLVECNDTGDVKDINVFIREET